MNSNDTKRLFNFLEELSWVFKSHRNLNISEVLEEILLNTKIRNSIVHNPQLNINVNDKNRLIGFLPELLNDKKLFTKNSDLVEFAESAFHISINRSEKRSRYEIIGLIIMEIFELKNSEILDITDSIQTLSNNSNLKTLLRKKKKSSDFSWNNAIREITNQ